MRTLGKSLQRIGNRRSDRPARLLSFVSLCAIVIACINGCARWHGLNKTEEPASGLPIAATKPSTPDTVTIETALVRYDEDRVIEMQRVWALADESIIDFEQRRLLDCNGIRVGVIRGELPQQLVQQMEASRQQQQQDIVEQLGLGADVDSRIRTLDCRAGRRKELVVRRELAHPLSVISTVDGSMSGHVFDRATALLSMTVYPQTDGKATIELVPEVQYGEPKQSFVSAEFGMRQEMKRDSKIWKQFKIRATLASSEVLMISSSTPSKALGHAFFTTETNKRTEEHVVVLIRLASTQMDNLFNDDIVNQARALMDQP